MQTPSWKDITGRYEDDVSSNSGRTEDSLISSRTSSQTVSSTHARKRSITKYCPHNVRRHCCQYKLLITSIFLSIFGVIQVIFPPYDVLLSLRLRMTPGLPPFEWWYDPPEEVVAKVYIFNVTNSEKFLDGTDKKIKLQELGPIIYREKLKHSNVVFNENGTLTYSANRTLIYLPERNPVYLLNQTITMPNIAVLFIPSYFYDAPFFVRFGINLMMRRLKSETFKTATIEEFLWNMTDPILDVSQSIAPALVPMKNVGILSKVYQDFADNITVYIGPKYDHKDFFKINNVNGLEYMYLKQGECLDPLVNSSEGVTYSQHITKNDTLKYFRKTFCGVADLKFTKEIVKNGFKAYRFEMGSETYDRKESTDQDCYRGQPVLPNGLRDVSSCNYDTSVAASNPHFLHGDFELVNSVEGIKPDSKLHTSYVEVEPITGLPLEGSAKSQLNVVVKDMMGFNEKLHKFNNLNIPLAWLEYHQEGIPSKIKWLLYLQVVFLPVFQTVFMIITFLVSFLLLVLFLVNRRKCRNNLEKNRAIAFEAEKFLKQ